MEQDIIIEKYVIVAKGDYSVGERDSYYTLGGNFIFVSKENKKNFEDDLKKLFQDNIEPDRKIFIFDVRGENK